MMKHTTLLAVTLLTVASTLLAACATSTPVPTPTTVPSPTSAPVSASTAVTYTDPFAYCAAVGTIDAPGAGYTGEAVPNDIVTGYLKAANLQNSTEPMDLLKQTTSWRCMGGQVYACNVGANLPCDSQADTSQTPTQAMNDYCTANPDADFIPASVTGHDSIYSWKCVKGTASAFEQVDQPDAAG
ncbi:MAG TPA: hypothetical protein VMC62_00405, partial [Longilinea sp.]|nr:hypothetical protein [Longilinea sp.]